MSLHESFNRSAFSTFVNSGAGRILRLLAGVGFLVAGYAFRHTTLGVVLMICSVVPLAAGVFDWCYISALLGGPLSGVKIRGLRK
jgi:hypothetical protein